MDYKPYEIPTKILRGTYFCHKCGEKLEQNTRTRTVKRGDPDYREHSRVRAGGKTYYRFGDIQVTEYNLFCPTCNTSIEYADQCLIARIQEKLTSHKLTQQDVDDNIEEVERISKRKKTIRMVVVYVLLAIYLCFTIIFGGEIRFWF